MENQQRPMRKKSYSLVDETSNLRFDDEEGFPVPNFGPHAHVSHSKSLLNTHSAREIGSLCLEIGHSMASLRIDQNVDTVQSFLIPNQIVEMNASVTCIYDFILSMILSYVNCQTIADEKITRIFEDNFEIATEPQYVNFLSGIQNNTLAVSSENFILVDCRFEYEFEGGHIINAVNINDPSVIKYLFIDNEDLFADFKFRKHFNHFKNSIIDLQKAHWIIREFRESDPTALDLPTAQYQDHPIQNPSTSDKKCAHKEPLTSETPSQSDRLKSCLNSPLSITSSKRSSLVIVFYCEFSSQRAPRMWRFVREADRAISGHQFVLYNDIYLLKGGYKKFVEEYPSQCVSSNFSKKYVSMWDKKYATQRSISMSMHNSYWMVYDKRTRPKNPPSMPSLWLNDFRGKRMSVPIQASESLFKLFSKQL